MKTYLLDILNKFQRFGENLDVKTILCNKAWLIFNDSGDKEVYIFQENGTLLVSVNGEVSNAAWQYVPANKSLIISSNGHSYMLCPSFLDDVIFALQQDGTNKFAFMIHEEQSKNFQPKSLAELNAYFEAKVQKQLEAQRQAEINAMAEKRAKAESALRNIATTKWEKEKKNILKNDAQYQLLKRRSNEQLFKWLAAVGLMGLILVLSSTVSIFGNGLRLDWRWTLALIFVLLVVLSVKINNISEAKYKCVDQLREKFINKYIENSFV